VRYTHRRVEEREIYFVANRSDQAVQTTGTFRAAIGLPELWDPVTGTLRPLPQFARTNGLTTIPLRFAPFESYFVLFPSRAEAVAVSPRETATNFDEVATVGTLAGSWSVSFDPALGAPAAVTFERLEDWTQRPEAGIRYYSGIATYRKTFDLPQLARGRSLSPIYLDLGDVRVMARVRVNGQDCGVAWTAPWRVDITAAVQSTGNRLEIEVANLWPNRMIGDALSPAKPYTATTYRPYKATDPLLPSGLLGPVTLMK
jgi:hypothetical protein